MLLKLADQAVAEGTGIFERRPCVGRVADGGCSETRTPNKEVAVIMCGFGSCGVSDKREQDEGQQARGARMSGA
jgi:hypothetical protein